MRVKEKGGDEGWWRGRARRMEGRHLEGVWRVGALTRASRCHPGCPPPWRRSCTSQTACLRPGRRRRHHREQGLLGPVLRLGASYRSTVLMLLLRLRLRPCCCSPWPPQRQSAGSACVHECAGVQAAACMGAWGAPGCPPPPHAFPSASMHLHAPPCNTRSSFHLLPHPQGPERTRSGPRRRLRRASRWRPRSP